MSRNVVNSGLTNKWRVQKYGARMGYRRSITENCVEDRETGKIRKFCKEPSNAEPDRNLRLHE